VVRILIARHASTPDTGIRLTGRAAGTHLSSTGIAEARALARAVAHLGVECVYTSPLERAVETASTVAAHCRVPVEVEPAFTEIDFGTWTGQRFDELTDLPEWQVFNCDPLHARIPRGESVASVANRGLRGLRTVTARHRRGTLLVVTHGDVIRLLLTRVLAMPIGSFRRLAIAPASLSCVEIDGGEACVALVNHRPAASGFDGGLS
jgi:broad specificity phosphatase PhoE